MERLDLIQILNSIRTDENSKSIEEIIAKVEKLDDETIRHICEGKTIEEIAQILICKVNEALKKKQEEPWRNLNDIFCYARTGSTIHIHIIPSDLRPLKEQLGDESFKNFIKQNLENALIKLQEIFKADITIGEVFAVSPIFYHPDWKEIFESLDFEEIQEVILGNGMDNFLEEFNKDGGKTKRVFYTKIQRKQFLENKYEKTLYSEREQQN